MIPDNSTKNRNIKCDILVGGQWGDEGKAKIIDYLAKSYDIICRYQGGNNAGHTVVYQNKKYIFHLLPSGVLNPKTISVLGHGMVIYLPKLIEEIKNLEQNGIILQDRLRISDRAFVVTDYHLELDHIKENKDFKIGTTTRGIGPAYTDKYSREGIRIADLFYPEILLKKITTSLKIKQILLQNYYGHKCLLQAEKITENLLSDFSIIKPYVENTIYFLNEALTTKNILLEGAQGAGLDIDFGSYPYVTSSSPTSGGGAIGSGIAVTHFKNIIGIFKAYVTRVGEGALPTLISDEQEKSLRQKGEEFGATTGRSRRCGWFDGVQARYSVMVNGINTIALTKLDVLNGFDTIKFCTHYEIAGIKTNRFPSSITDLDQSRPIYREFPGWNNSISHVKSYKNLHPHARNFINFLEEYLRCPVNIISTGASREDTILRN